MIRTVVAPDGRELRVGEAFGSYSVTWTRRLSNGFGDVLVMPRDRFDHEPTDAEVLCFYVARTMKAGEA